MRSVPSLRCLLSVFAVGMVCPFPSAFAISMLCHFPSANDVGVCHWHAPSLPLGVCCGHAPSLIPSVRGQRLPLACSVPSPWRWLLLLGVGMLRPFPSVFASACPIPFPQRLLWACPSIPLGVFRRCAPEMSACLIPYAVATQLNGGSPHCTSLCQVSRLYTDMFIDIHTDMCSD